MNKTAIKNFAVWARNKLIADISYKAGLMGISEDGIKATLPQSTKDMEFYDIGTKEPYVINGEAVRQRKRLAELINQRAAMSDYKTAYRAVIEEVAYTWFNRLIAIRFMEVNDYLPSRIRALSSESSSKLEPDLVTTPFDAELELSDYEKSEIVRLKNENLVDECFRMLFVKQCNALNEVLPMLFETTADYSELLLNVSVTDQDGVVYHLVHDIPEDDFNISKIGEDGKPTGQVEIIGWLYQYYNTEDFNAIYDGALSKEQVTKYLVPAATQLFTPDWVVRFMIENALGRLWIEGHPNPELKSEWKYYLDEAEQEADVQAQLEKIREEYKTIKPEDIKVIDPCMGSGHILVYAFDVLMQIYEAAGYTQREAAKSILENNIYGLDIDDRAFQLAYFAVMMKARQYNRRNLNSETVCHVYSIQESNTVNRAQLKYFGAGLNDLERNDSMNQIAGLLDTFVDAKEYGSILNVDACNWDLLRRFVAEINDAGQMSLDSIGLEETKGQLRLLIEIGQVMAQKYDVVVTNPPYLGSGKFNAKLSSYIEHNYFDEKPDLGMVMLKKILFSLVKRNGFMGAITTVSWMFIKSFEKFRQNLLMNKDFVCMVDFGTELFEGKIGHLPVASWINRNSHIEQIFTSVRLVDYCYSRRDEKKQEFYNRTNYYSICQAEFQKIAGSPIAYWISKTALDAFAGENLGSVSEPRMGLTTGRNDYYLRLWFEPDFHCIGFSKTREQAIDSELKWFPYDKGGDFRKWYGNRNFVVNWYNDGHEMQTTMHPDGARIWAHNFNLDYNFREHISWNDVVMSNLSFRYFEKGFLFDSAAATIFVSPDKKTVLLAYLNSNFVNELAKLLNPTVHFKLGDYSKLPFGNWDEKLLSGLAEQCIRITKEDWDSYETSWDFQRHPLIGHEQRISDAMRTWNDICIKRRNELTALEERIDRYFEDFYMEKINGDNNGNRGNSVNLSNTEADVKSLISYAVGCMFGRYSIDKCGLVYAGGAWDESQYSSFIPDEDNIIPITDEEYFQDDIVGMLCEWLKNVYGADTLEENLDYIAKSLGNKGDTSREAIRYYFLSEKGFYKDHCNTYSVTGSGKRPIYWLFDSGKQNGFKALIYMHRYDENTIGNLRIDYLHRMERVYESEIARMQDIIDNSRDGREVTKATKRKEKLQKQIKECKEYDEKIAHLALARIPIDLDDGVKVNYEKVQTVDGKKYPVLAKI